MTRTISLITGIVVTALAVAVPTAFGEGRLAGSIEPDAVAAFKANEMSTLSQSRSVPVVSRPDSHDVIRGDERGYIDAADRAQRIDVPVATALTDSHERSTQPQGLRPVSIGTTAGGNEVDWPQLGIGFGVGLLLAFGLFLTVRTMRTPPLAH